MNYLEEDSTYDQVPKFRVVMYLARVWYGFFFSFYLICHKDYCFWNL